MIKILIGISVTLAAGWLVVGFLIVPTGQLLEISVSRNYQNHWLRSPAFLYLQHLRGLKAYPRETWDPPIHVIVKTCDFTKDSVCPRALKWVLSLGEKVNEDDKSALGFTPLHWSAYGCDPVSAKILISNGARLDSRASGERFKDKTPRQVLAVMEKATCRTSKDKEMIETLLKDDVR